MLAASMSIVIEDLVGLTAARSLGILFSSLQNVREVHIAQLSPLPPLQNRLNLTSAERTVVERALELRRRTGLSFWDAALLELLSVPNADGLLDAALSHVSLRGHERALSWEEINAGALERACTEFPVQLGSSLTLLSEVTLHDGSIGLLPMIDFHAFKSPANQRLVESVAERLFPSGSILVDSGESYHAYGNQILSQEGFIRFLGTALLFVPIVDRAYVAHQLIEGRCALRLTPGGGKSKVPTVVAVLPKK
jgi:hypothetical protein